MKAEEIADRNDDMAFEKSKVVPLTAVERPKRTTIDVMIPLASCENPHWENSRTFVLKSSHLINLLTLARP